MFSLTCVPFRVPLCRPQTDHARHWYWLPSRYCMVHYSTLDLELNLRPDTIDYLLRVVKIWARSREASWSDYPTEFPFPFFSDQETKQLYKVITCGLETVTTRTVSFIYPGARDDLVIFSIDLKEAVEMVAEWNRSLQWFSAKERFVKKFSPVIYR